MDRIDLFALTGNKNVLNIRCGTWYGIIFLCLLLACNLRWVVSYSPVMMATELCGLKQMATVEISLLVKIYMNNWRLLVFLRLWSDYQEKLILLCVVVVVVRRSKECLFPLAVLILMKFSQSSGWLYNIILFLITPG